MLVREIVPADATEKGPHLQVLPLPAVLPCRVYAKREIEHHTNRSNQEACFMRILSYERAHPNKGGDEDAVRRRAKARPQASRDHLQHRHDGLEDTQMARASALFPTKVKDPNIRPVP